MFNARFISKFIFGTSARALARTGRQLAAQLDRVAADLPVKSDECTTLLWEADVVRAKSDDAERKCGVSPSLRESVLLRTRVNGIYANYPELIDQLKAFHAAYDEQAGQHR